MKIYLILNSNTCPQSSQWCGFTAECERRWRERLDGVWVLGKRKNVILKVPTNSLTYTI